MIYLAETDLPKNKSIVFSLISVYGIGRFTSKKICKKLGVSINYKTKDLNNDQIIELFKIIESMKLQLGSDLRKKNASVSKNLVSIKTYRGLRKFRGLPVRGQRTHTNAKTSRRHKRT